MPGGAKARKTGQCRELLINSFNFEFYNCVFISFLWNNSDDNQFYFQCLYLEKSKGSNSIAPPKLPSSDFGAQNTSCVWWNIISVGTTDSKGNSI